MQPFKIKSFVDTLLHSFNMISVGFYTFNQCLPTFVRMVFVIITILFLTNCSSTGSKIKKNIEVSKIRNIGIEVTVPKGMELLDTSEDSAWLGFMLFGLVGASIEESIRHNQDARTASVMQPHMNAATYRERVESLIKKVLESSGKFSMVQIVNQSSMPSSLNAVLVINVLQWGVRANHVDRGDEKIMEFGHLVDYKLMEPDRGKNLWQERQLFVSGHPRTLSEYQKDPQILTKDLDYSMTRFCHLIVNRLIY